MRQMGEGGVPAARAAIIPHPVPMSICDQKTKNKSAKI